MPRRLKIYIGCALTHAPARFRGAIDKVKVDLRRDFSVLEFVGLERGTPKDVFRHDTACVASSDVFVAVCTYPGIGLGYELGVAVERGKPILALAREGVSVTRLVQGVQSPLFRFRRYRKESDVPRIIRSFTTSLQRKTF